MHVLLLLLLLFFSYSVVGSVITDEGSKPEILSRIAQDNSSIDKAETSLE